MAVTWDQLELPLADVGVVQPAPAQTVDSPPEPCRLDRSPMGTFSECPMCGSALAPEHAHFRCNGCGWRDSCCD